MILQAIRWKNLLSTGNAWIAIPLNSNPMTLIVGKNGHGKSLLLDAICFGLFNQAFRDINKNQLVNTINKKQLVVEVILESHGSTFVIKRGIKPNLLEIYKNGDLIPQSADVTEYQQMLEQDILGIDYKTFCQINIIGKASYVPFMQLKADRRRKVVEDLLDGQVYGKMLVIAKKEASNLHSELIDVNAQIQIADQKRLSLETLISRRKSDVANFEANIAAQINKIDTEIALTQQICDEDQNALLGAVSDIDNVVVDVDLAKQTVSQLKSDIALLQAELRLLSSMSVTDEPICSHCKQVVDQQHKQKVLDEIAEKTKQLTRDIDGKKTKQIKLDVILMQYDNAVERKKACAIRIDRHTSKIETLKESKAKINSQFDFKGAAEQLEQDQQALAQAQADLTKATEKYDDLHKQIDIVKKCVALLADDGLKTQMINKYIPLINQSINTFLEKMDLMVHFELDSQFNETIKSRYRDTFSYQSFSEGEKLRIDLAILYTWRYIASLKNSVKCNLLVMDEVLDGSLDDDGAVDFIQYLQSTTDADNTIIISHKKAIVENFENVIVAEKNGNFTEYSTN